MISIMELMEKKTPSIKNTDRKKGMTLVEVMAAMAILSILFMGISNLIIGIVKNEAKSERRLESDGYLKNALLMFESGVLDLDNLKEFFKDKPTDEYIEFIIKFDDMIQIKEIEECIAKAIEGEGNSTYGDKEITITITKKSDDLYRINGVFKNSRKEEYSKYVYIFIE